MKYFHSFLLLLIIAYGIFESIQAQDQSEFISLACGLVPKETVYTEKSTNIIYESDANYIDSGLVGRINDANKTRLQQQYWTLRSFPEGERNCYNFNLTANRKYLIKASFNYGNYDDLNRLPRFDLHIGPNKWTSVSFPGGRYGSNREMIHVLTQNRLQVCLVKTGETTPFINSLEIRPLHNGTYVTQSGSLILVSRVYFSPTPLFVRYDDDIHDRTWLPYSDDQKVSIRTDLFVNTSNFYDVPEVVAKTAAVPKNASQPLTLNWTLSEITAQTYIYMHFAEIHNLEANDIREFNITYNGGKNWFPYYRPRKLQMRTLYNPRALNSPDGKFNFSFVMTGNSTLPPLINALEIYNVLNFLQLDTSQDEGNSDI
uniref:Malectin-like domain-containing protein n=1 Tax=Brassica oleracea var. oleracea TaxID=109376 RepID=A0A0D3BJ67_BRAOL